MARLPLLSRLRRHHQAHHDPKRMGRYNFNITFPLCDRLLGTEWSERRSEKREPSDLFRRQGRPRPPSRLPGVARTMSGGRGGTGPGVFTTEGGAHSGAASDDDRRARSENI